MLYEIPPTDRAETRSQRSRLDALITRCRDSSNSYRAASRVPSAHRSELMAIARRRSLLARRLAEFSATPDERNTRGSVAGRMARFAFDLRVVLLGQSHLGDSLADCLRCDHKATETYVRALAIRWNGDIADVLEEQRAEIEHSAAAVKAIRGRL